MRKRNNRKEKGRRGNEVEDRLKEREVIYEKQQKARQRKVKGERKRGGEAEAEKMVNKKRKISRIRNKKTCDEGGRGG